MDDKSKKMNFEQRTRLMYAKGGRYFEDVPVRDATLDGIGLDFIKSYAEEIGRIATLLFGKNPQRFSNGPGFVLSAIKAQKSCGCCASEISVADASASMVKTKSRLLMLSRRFSFFRSFSYLYCPLLIPLHARVICR